GEYAWINENCQDYGWVVRYDQAKAELTGIYDEPWHFRYVGVPHATKMAGLDLCLEENIDYLKDFTFEGGPPDHRLRLRTVRGLVRPGDEDLPPRRRGVHRLRQQCGRPDRHVQGGVMAV